MEHNETQQIVDLWRYRSGLNDGRSILGYDVEARDGSIGKIDESTDDTAQHIVVDTGFWIFGKKRRIPAGMVQGIDHDSKKVWLSLTKDQVKAAPDHEAHTVGDRTSTFGERDTDSIYYEPLRGL